MLSWRSGSCKAGQGTSFVGIGSPQSRGPLDLLQLSMTFGERFLHVNFGVGFIVSVITIWVMVGLTFNTSEKNYKMSLTFLGNQDCDEECF